MKVTAREMANKFLDHLKDNERWIGTNELLIPIFQATGLKNTAANRETSRNILRRLTNCNLILRNGKGKFEWCLKHEAKWDHNDPFRNEVKVDDDDEKETDDNTQDEKVESFEEEHQKWVKPAQQTESDQKLLLKTIRIENDLKEAKNRITVIEKELDAKENRLDLLEKMATTASQLVRTMRIEKYDGKVFTLKNVVLPSYFQDVVDLAECRRNIMLVGPAGCGKTTVAELVAKRLGLTFGKVGGSAGLTEIHLLGKANQNIAKGTEKYRASEFVNRYEQGGLMLVDELDAADQNVLLALNPALDRSGMLPLVNRLDNPIAKKHKDFVCVATANTFGKGQDRIYAGRNQLDGATLSRFRIGMIECYYDEMIEKVVCPDDELRTEIQGFRRRMEEASIRQVIDTRFLEDAFTMKEHKKWGKDKIYKSLFAGWSKNEKSVVMAA